MMQKLKLNTEIAKNLNPEFFILIDGKPFVGYVGVSEDMDLSLRKSGLKARKAGITSGFLLRKVEKLGNKYVGINIYRINKEKDVRI